MPTDAALPLVVCNTMLTEMGGISMLPDKLPDLEAVEPVGSLVCKIRASDARASHAIDVYRRGMAEASLTIL